MDAQSEFDVNEHLKGNRLAMRERIQAAMENPAPDEEMLSKGVDDKFIERYPQSFVKILPQHIHLFPVLLEEAYRDDPDKSNKIDTDLKHEFDHIEEALKSDTGQLVNFGIVVSKNRNGEIFKSPFVKTFDSNRYVLLRTAIKPGADISNIDLRHAARLTPRVIASWLKERLTRK